MQLQPLTLENHQGLIAGDGVRVGARGEHERVGSLGVHTLEDLLECTRKVHPARRARRTWAQGVPEKPGVYCFVGNGDTPNVHHPMYVFDQANLPVGAAYWVAVAQAYLK